MGRFAEHRRARSAHETPLSPHFEAVGEALAAGTDVLEASWVAGRRLAEDGTSLGEGLEGLRAATRLIRHRDPLFDETRALSLAWSEATLGYLHGLSCNDPLTGLSTLPHIRERISDLYRDTAARSHALVVTQAELTAGGDSVSNARALTLLGRTARTVFSGAETIGQVRSNRIVVLAPRNDQLARRASLLKQMAQPAAVRVWIEGLPETDDRAATLLDELARGA